MPQKAAGFASVVDPRTGYRGRAPYAGQPFRGFQLAPSTLPNVAQDRRRHRRAVITGRLAGFSVASKQTELERKSSAAGRGNGAAPRKGSGIEKTGRAATDHSRAAAQRLGRARSATPCPIPRRAAQQDPQHRNCGQKRVCPFRSQTGAILLAKQ